ncbi:MAG: hypothetical protein ABJD07_05355 [Gemmatimonadaceae bacterium]
MTLRISALAAGASLATFIAFAAPAGAQSLLAPDGATVAAVAAVAAVGPMLANTSVALRSASPERDGRPFTAHVTGARAAGKFSENGRYMIIGGVTFLAGAIIGSDVGTVMMVGGAAVGIYGLYRYLESPASAEMARKQELGTER